MRFNINNYSSIRMRRPNFFSNKIILIMAAILVVAGIALIINMVHSATSSNSKTTIQGAKKTQTINKEFAFPIKDDKGKEVTRTKYTVEAAELRDQILVQGRPATAIAGKTFLIFNIKLVNEYDKPIKISTSDFARLSVNNTDQWVAPDIHSDPVTIQAISTKETRIGFAIFDTDKDIKLRIGEITGQKSVIDVKF